MIRSTGSNSEDTFGLFSRLFCPPEPSADLTRWLWLLTPPGAPTVPVLESTDRDDGPGHVPLLKHDPLIRSSRLRLERVRGTLPRGLPRKPGHQAPRDGIGRWAIEVAYFRDLRGEGTAQIADRLGLTDHLGPASESRDGDQSRSARRYVKRGRKTLAALGAWPWMLEDNGRLGRGWWRDNRFATALFAWHREAGEMAINDALLAIDCVGGEEVYRTNGDRLTTAAELYREHLRRLAEKAEAA